jgi:hypothetical protein
MAASSLPPLAFAAAWSGDGDNLAHTPEEKQTPREATQHAPSKPLTTGEVSMAAAIGSACTSPPPLALSFSC